MDLHCLGKHVEINVKSHIISEELFQHIKEVSGLGDAMELKQWNDNSGWVMVNSAEDIEPADGAMFCVVCMYTVSLTCEWINRKTGPVAQGVR